MSDKNDPAPGSLRGRVARVIGLGVSSAFGGILPTLISWEQFHSNGKALPSSFDILQDILMMAAIGIGGATIAGAATIRQAIVSGIGAPAIIAAAKSGTTPDTHGQNPAPVNQSPPPGVAKSDSRLLPMFSMTALAADVPTRSVGGSGSRIMYADAIIPSEAAGLSGYSMYITTANSPLEIKRFPLGHNVPVELPSEVREIKLVAGDVARKIGIPANDFKLCITGIQVQIQNQFGSVFGYPRELTPSSFEIQAHEDFSYVCQDKELNARIRVFTQWRAADGRRNLPEVSELSDVLAGVGFRAAPPEYKDYVGTGGHSVGCQIDNAVGERLGNLRHVAVLERRELSWRRRPAVAAA